MWAVTVGREGCRCRLVLGWDVSLLRYAGINLPDRCRDRAIVGDSLALDYRNRYLGTVNNNRVGIYRQ